MWSGNWGYLPLSPWMYIICRYTPGTLWWSKERLERQFHWRPADHITPILRRLHWLPVRRRVDFKIAVLVFQCLTGQAPGYLAEDCQLVADVSVRWLRSADTATCVTRLASNVFGDRCFAAAGPRLWNSLPINLRQCRSLEQFKRLLNTFLFSAWGDGALWYFTLSAPHINPLTYLPKLTVVRTGVEYSLSCFVLNNVM